jgi:hypothetical protein
MVVHLPMLLYNLLNSANSAVKLIFTFVLQNKVLLYFQLFVYFLFLSQTIISICFLHTSILVDHLPTTANKLTSQEEEEHDGTMVSLNKDDVRTFCISLYYDLIATRLPFLSITLTYDLPSSACPNMYISKLTPQNA